MAAASAGVTIKTTSPQRSHHAKVLGAPVRIDVRSRDSKVTIVVFFLRRIFRYQTSG
jgi:hypothetical protein